MDGELTTKETSTTSAQQASTPADTGLGFDEFLNETPPEGATPSPEKGAQETKPEGSTDKKAEPEEQSEPETTKAGEGETAEPESTQKPAETMADTKLTELEGRLKQTRDYATTVNQKNATLEAHNRDLSRRLEVMEKKISGEWTEADEAALQAERQVDSSAQVENAALGAKVRTSIAAAKRVYGEERMNALLFAENAPYRQLDQNPAINLRVMSAEEPAIEAMRVVEEEEFFSKYGRDPKIITEKIRAELKPEVIKELRAEFDARIQKKGNELPSLGTQRGSSTPTSGTNGTDKGDGIEPLRDVVGNRELV